MTMAKAHTWNEDQPIYRQLMEELLARILDGTYAEGQLLPSVRQLASDFQINPLTVAKAFQELAKEDVTEKRRGIGMMVREGVRDALVSRERNKFLKEEWPTLVARMERMGIDVKALLRTRGPK
jgi:GntR family transcriptional regulator